MAEREYPMVDGAPLNPYDLPGEPRPGDDPEKYEAAPTAEESAPVPGPGDPESTTFVEIGDDGTGEALPPVDPIVERTMPGNPFMVVSDDQAAALRSAGFDSADKIRNASDDDLDAVEGIGPATVARLREATRV